MRELCFLFVFAMCFLHHGHAQSLSAPNLVGCSSLAYDVEDSFTFSDADRNNDGNVNETDLSMFKENETIRSVKNLTRLISFWGNNANVPEQQKTTDPLANVIQVASRKENHTTYQLQLTLGAKQRNVYAFGGVENFPLSLPVKVKNITFEKIDNEPSSWLILNVTNLGYEFGTFFDLSQFDNSKNLNQTSIILFATNPKYGNANSMQTMAQITVPDTEPNWTATAVVWGQSKEGGDWISYLTWNSCTCKTSICPTTSTPNETTSSNLSTTMIVVIVLSVCFLFFCTVVTIWFYKRKHSNFPLYSNKF